MRILTLFSLFFAAQLHAKPLQVFILAGQSNMQGHAKISTFEHIGMDPSTKPMLDEMQNVDGTLKVCERGWISSIGCAGDDTTEQTGKLTAGYGATTEKVSSK
jgi:alpha-galactosidase